MVAGNNSHLSKGSKVSHMLGNAQLEELLTGGLAIRVGWTGVHLDMAVASLSPSSSPQIKWKVGRVEGSSHPSMVSWKLPLHSSIALGCSNGGLLKLDVGEIFSQLKGLLECNVFSSIVTLDELDRDPTLGFQSSQQSGHCGDLMTLGLEEETPLVV